MDTPLGYYQNKRTRDKSRDIIIPTIYDEHRPYCECGTLMHSNGPRWLCSGCGHSKVKHWNKPLIVKCEYDCPKCGSDKKNMRDKGHTWWCKSCGKYTAKKLLIKLNNK